MLELENVFQTNFFTFEQGFSLGYLVLLIAVPMARVNIIFCFLLFFCEAEKRKTDNLCAKLAVGSLFSQYHHSYISIVPINPSFTRPFGTHTLYQGNLLLSQKTLTLMNVKFRRVLETSLNVSEMLKLVTKSTVFKITL